MATRLTVYVFPSDCIADTKGFAITFLNREPECMSEIVHSSMLEADIKVCRDDDTFAWAQDMWQEALCDIIACEGSNIKLNLH